MSDIDDYQSHSRMLGRIASRVEEFCDSEECSTLRAVMLMKLELLNMKVVELERQLENE